MKKKEVLAVLLSLLASGCTGPHLRIERNVVAEGQKIYPLTATDEQKLKKQRAVVTRYISEDDLKTKYLTAAGKLGALRAILAAHLFKANQTYEIQSMGVVLGG